MALADGASSCKHADIGAEIATSSVSNFICKNFESLYESKKSTIVKKILEVISHSLNQKSIKLGIDINEMASHINLIHYDSKLFSTLSINGREFIENNFTEKVIYTKWEKVYNKIGFRRGF